MVRLPRSGSADEVEEEGEHGLLAGGAGGVLGGLGEAEMRALAGVVEGGEEGESTHAEVVGDGEGSGADGDSE